MKKKTTLFILVPLLSSTTMATPFPRYHTTVHIPHPNVVKNEQKKEMVVTTNQIQQPITQENHQIINNNQMVTENTAQQTEHHKIEQDNKLRDNKVPPSDLQNNSTVTNKATVEPKKSGLLSTSLLFDDKKPISSTYKNKQQSQNVIYINQPAYRYR